MGGLAGGLSNSNTGSSTITNCYATGAVSSTDAGGNSGTGGLVGRLGTGTITSSYATGNVTATNNRAGGLVGFFGAWGTGHTSLITKSYATGNVQSATITGGLVGVLEGYASDGNVNTISDSYARGNATSTGGVAGGLIAQLDVDAASVAVLSRNYASGTAAVGSGTARYAFGPSTNMTSTSNYYNSTANTSLPGGQAGTAVTAANLAVQGSFTGFNFTTTWIMGTASPFFPVLR